MSGMVRCNGWKDCPFYKTKSGCVHYQGRSHKKTKGCSIGKDICDCLPLKTRKVRRETKYNKAVDAVARYLKSIGWKPLVGSFTGIEHGEGKYKFRLIFNFTGSPPKTNKKEED